MTPGRPPLRVLVVEDETDLAQLLADYLVREGFRAEVIADGAQALAALREKPPDLVLLDVMLPGLDGLGVLRELRRFSEVPVILVTARVEEIDRLLGLELGADDYVCKPYSPREVVARVKTVLRRTRPPAAVPGPGGAVVEVDPASWQAHAGGHRLDLTPKEFKLLQILTSRPGHVFSRSRLLELLYEDNLDVSDRAVDSHLKNLRRKLALAIPDRELIRSIYGVGYVLEP